jgi:hypothetical protein
VIVFVIMPSIEQAFPFLKVTAQWPVAPEAFKEVGAPAGCAEAAELGGTAALGCC